MMLILFVNACELQAPWWVAGNQPRADWPNSGTIVFKDYSTRYRPGLDLILKQINFEVNGKEKVGILYNLLKA